MSRTYHLVCADAKSYLWVGQGYGTDQNHAGLVFYNSEDHAARLWRFLDHTAGKALRLYDSEFSPDMDDETITEFEGEP